MTAVSIRIIDSSTARQLPWKNGKGETIELARAERDGALLWRLSMATVAEDGPFSIFAGIERNLTVLDGAGFEHLPSRQIVLTGGASQIPGLDGLAAKGALVRAVCDAVKDQRMDARIAGQHLERGTRSGIAFAYAGKIFAQAAEHARGLHLRKGIVVRCQ